MPANIELASTVKTLPSLTDGLSPLMILAFISLALFVGLVSKGLYNVYFHPLSKFPGPFSSAFTGLIYIWYWVRGDLVAYIEDLHRAYGRTVRIAPNRLSFIDPAVWKDVYGYKTTANKKATVMKDPRQYGPESNGRFSLLSKFDDAEHKALRKVFQPGFSDRALKAQEGIIRMHVDKLIRNMYNSISKDPHVQLDFVRLFNCTTFDIIGELAFGESLGLLDDGKMYGWIDSLNSSLVLAPYITLASEFPLIIKAVMALLPKSVLASMDENARYASQLVEKRLAKGKVTEKADFWTLVLSNKDSEILDREDMMANANLFMAAGSETTATMLAGLMYNLLSNLDKLEKLLKEVRGAFSSADELTIESIQQLKYLAACFEESMRIYPSTPLGGPRVVLNGGGEVNGEFVPENTIVAISTYGSYHSPHNFKDPESFVPERWMPSDPLYQQYANDRRDVFQPFSYGPRNCIGKNLALHEMRLIAVSLLWNFDFELCEESRRTWLQQKCYWALWHKHPLWLKVKPVKKGTVTTM